MSEFVKYVMRFYGKGGIYDFGATEEDIVIATDIRLKNKPEIPFDGDSLDREIVRDILLDMKPEYVFPEGGA
jgi:hypothetical protein|tara:strand:+ start:947 stop:1162 length:216 start_codon:yes stop_codon:yes gene_type:complete